VLPISILSYPDAAVCSFAALFLIKVMGNLRKTKKPKSLIFIILLGKFFKPFLKTRCWAGIKTQVGIPLTQVTPTYSMMGDGRLSQDPC
jgi:hypothetical protein